MGAPRTRRGVAILVLGSFLAALMGGPAAAASSTSTTSSSTPTTTNTNAKWVGVGQTVVIDTSATGKLSGTPRVFTQLSANGSGPVTLKVPMSASGFRNLSGFGKAPITGGYAVWNLHLSGPTQQRSVAHFPSAKLPLQVSTTYELNGKKMKAQHIVGKSGELKVSYVITNTTTQPTTVSFTNVLGSKETRTVKAPVPIAADFSVTFPANFTNLKAPGATANGNGNGTSSAAWTLFLFDPLGGVKQSVTYQAHVTNAVVPSATLSAAVLPPTTTKPLPAIKEPGAPAVPTVTLGGHLATLQTKIQAARAKLAAKAAAALSAFKQVAVPAVRRVAGGAANVADRLPALSAAAQALSTNIGNESTSLAQASTQATGASTSAGPVQAGLTQAAAGAADASARVGHVQTDLNQAAAGAADVSGRTGDLQGRVSQAVAEASDAATRIAAIQNEVEALPASVKATSSYSALHADVVELGQRLSTHHADLATAAGRAGDLEAAVTPLAALLKASAARAGDLGARLAAVSGALTRTSSLAATVLGTRLTALSRVVAQASASAANALAPAAHTASADLAGLVPTATALSTNATDTANTIAEATLRQNRRQARTIQPRQVGGGAHLDHAVGQLDAAITDAANKVDNAYAYLTALNKRSSDNELPAGNAKGATAQVGAFVYSVSGANDSAHKSHLSAFIGGFALVLGLCFGIGLYRIRRGMPSSLAPPKSSHAAAHG